MLKAQLVNRMHEIMRDRKLTQTQAAHTIGMSQPDISRLLNFREWKGERIERLAGDHVVAAFSAGTLPAAERGLVRQLEWVAVSGSGDAPCPDCEDNGLNGSQAPGEEFPTGHRHPPAHPGCRCLLARSAT